jgi:hypothetical protein
MRPGVMWKRPVRSSLPWPASNGLAEWLRKASSLHCGTAGVQLR